MTVVLVTGANRGIGFGIVRRLANEYASSALGQSGGPLTIYLGARTLSKGEEARSQLVSELPARAANIVPCTLDVASNESIAACAQQIGPVDVLINNAGISLEGFDADMVAQTLAVNYYAVKNVIKSVSFRDGGRIVNVASLAGTLHGLSPEIADRFLNAQTEHDVDTLMQEFQDAVKDAKCTERGWKQWAYGVSKTGLIAYTKVLAKTLKHQGSSTIVNACCPGFTKTDMTRNAGVLTIDEGASTPVFLALHDFGRLSGEFWSERKISPWMVELQLPPLVAEMRSKRDE